jgi:hypothetical protein
MHRDLNEWRVLVSQLIACGPCPILKHYLLIFISSTEKLEFLSASVSRPSGDIACASPSASSKGCRCHSPDDRYDTSVNAVDMLKCTEIESDGPCVTHGCSPHLNPEVGGARQLASPSLIDVLWERLAPACRLRRTVGRFGISHSLMSAAKRSCAALLMALHRIAPGGNFSACAKASDARAAQS